MLAPTGNMAEVYKRIARNQRRTIRRRAVKEINRVMASAPRMDAEIMAKTASWFLVQTFPGDDLRAMRWLARRRFGVFRPMQQRKVKHVEGQSIGGMEAVFPGWLFVYVFGLNDDQRARISICPGVMGLFTFPGTQRPVPIPDQFVQRLRALSWMVTEGLGRVAHEGERNQRPPKIGKQERQIIADLKKSLKDAGKFDQSTWSAAATLAPPKRIALLLATLNAAVVEGGAISA